MSPGPYWRMGTGAGGGHYNHSFFWKVMGKQSDNNGPSDALKAAIGESLRDPPSPKLLYSSCRASMLPGR